MDAGDAETGGGEFGGLVVHEGDERGDDECGAAACDGGKLIAEGFAGSGGHDEEDVTAVGGGAADGLLVGAELGEAEGLVEEGFEVHLLASSFAYCSREGDEGRLRVGYARWSGFFGCSFFVTGSEN